MATIDANDAHHNPITGEYTAKPLSEGDGGTNNDTMGGANWPAFTPLISGLGEIGETGRFDRIKEQVYALVHDDTYEALRAEWAIQAELRFMSPEESSTLIRSIYRAAHEDAATGTTSTLRTDKTIEDALAATDEWRAAAGIQLVDSSYTPPGSRTVDGYGPNPSEGDRYTGYRDVAEIAKECRVELKAAQAAGYLPNNLQYRVTVDKYAGGQSMRVVVCGLTDKQILTDDDPSHGGHTRGYTVEALELRSRVEQIADSWNRQDNHVQSDYFNTMYYSNVELEQERSRDFRQREADIRRAKRDRKGI